MKLLVESASNFQAKLILSNYLKMNRINVKFEEDSVGFGLQVIEIQIGLVFIWESILSGITWDLIKNTVLKAIESLDEKQRNKTNVYIEFEDEEVRYKIKIENSNGRLEISAPGNLKVKAK